ncbi:protein kinase [candidate division KSB1 bacterium]|nr:protein kinase [candidate division KSB1 bacterium]
MERMKDPLLNSTICQFRILEKRGQGAMGRVYKALDTDLQRIVALKLLSPALVRDEKALYHFRVEAIAASKINHPNICAIYEIGEDADHRFIAMEYVDGPTLSELLLAHGRISERDVLWIMEQVCSALGMAHAAGILHLDIKPDNILLGKNPTMVKITDFGVARLASEAAKMTAFASEQGPSADLFVPDLFTTTYTGIMGTAAYMSPEQVRREQVDHRSDIFSLGVTLVELLSGRKLFECASQISELERIATTDAPALLKNKTNVPGRWRPLIRKCIQSKPQDRHQSVGELLQDIRALKSRIKTPTSALFQTESTPRRKFRVSTWLLAASALVVLFIVASLSPTVRLLFAPPEPAPHFSSDVTTLSPDAYAYFLAGRQAWWRYADHVAINNLQLAVDNDTTFSYAYALLGVLLRWNERPDEGRLCLQKAKRHRGKLSEPEKLLVDGYSYYMLDNASAMLASFTKLTQQFPDFIDGHLGQALAFEVQRNFASAIKATANVLKIDSTHIAALANIADIYIWQAEFDSALCYANLRLRTLMNSPDRTGLGVAYEQVGAVHHYLGNVGEAIANLEVAIEQDPQNKDAIIALAEAYLLNDQVKAAERILKNHLLLALQPDERAAMYEYIAHFYVFTGRYKYALEHLDIANTLYREADFAHGVAWTHFNRCLLFRELGRADQAERELADARLYSQSRSSALLQTSFFIVDDFIVALQKGDRERAMTILQRKSRLISQSDRLFLESKYELARGQTAAAIDKLASLLQHDDRPILGLMIEAKYDLANLLLQTGDYDRAADYCSRALYTKRVLMFAQTPIFYGKSIALLAEIREKQGKIAEAIAACERFLHYWRDADVGMSLPDEVEERLERLRQMQKSPYIS